MVLGRTIQSIRGWTSSVSRVVRAHRHPLHCNEELEPFFIVGAPRSGNTLLRRMLTATQGIHIPPELPVMRRVVRTYSRQCYMPWELLVDCVLWQLRHVKRQVDRFGLSLRPLALELREVPEEKRSLAYILDSFYRFHADQTGQRCDRWGDKTPINRYAMKHIVRVFPRVRFIHILRDGVDGMHSMITNLLRRGYNAEDAAREWVRSIEAIDKFTAKHPDMVFEARYEQLVKDPTGQAERVYHFLDIPFDPAVIDRLDHTQKMTDVSVARIHENVNKPVFTGSIGKGRREFSEEEKKIIQSIAGPVLVRKGYEPVE